MKTWIIAAALVLIGSINQADAHWPIRHRARYTTSVVYHTSYPGYYAAPAPVYVAPAPVVYQTYTVARPVVVAPVVYQPVPVVTYHPYVYLW